jgi:hypothetical protein
VSTETSLESAALHEAGHVVVALALGLSPDAISVISVEQVGEDVWKGSSGCNPADKDRFRAAAVGCAGVLAEGRIALDEPAEGAEGDMSWVWTAAADLNRKRHPEVGDDPKDWLVYVAVGASVAARILAECWQVVRQIADQLIRDKRIDDINAAVDVVAINASGEVIRTGLTTTPQH